MQNTQEKETVTRVQKMYSTLYQAYEHIYSNGEKLYSEDYPLSAQGAEALYNKFKDYLKVQSDCGTGDGTSCNAPGENFGLNGEPNPANYATSDMYYKVLLADNSYLGFRGIYNNLAAIHYDVNGAKGPNTAGKDLFYFAFDTNGNFYAVGLSPKTGNTFSECLSKEDGASCTAWVVYKGNMDYLKCDDLSWDGKQKCD